VTESTARPTAGSAPGTVDRAPLRLMAVHAHPDDESSKGAATSARYAAEGVEVLVVSCTGGERGDVLNPSFGELPATAEGMAELRRAEMAAAAMALGVASPVLVPGAAGIALAAILVGGTFVVITMAAMQ